MSEWFSANDLLALCLPGLPGDKGALSRHISKHGWRQSPFAREGERGWEYHRSLLPAEAQADLVARRGREEQAEHDWAAFEALPESAKDSARTRLAIVEQVATLKSGGMAAGTAVSLTARREKVSASTLWNWLRLVDGKPRAHWLAALAPRHKGRTATAECDPRAWDFIVADYLRFERPRFAACHRRLVEAAAEHGWGPIPAAKTLQRRLEKTFPAAARTLAREGREALARIYPHQRRDRSGFAPLQAVNADGHKFDVFVKFENGTIGRPVASVVQDLGTGMILSHRLDMTENWNSIRLAFGDMVERFGIPETAYLDNGRGFASKWITGGQKTRFRFKIKDDEPEGVLTALGIKVHWTTPYHGQAKPIERAFRDLCEEIAKHPACAGAYTGNNPMAKPENYGSKAVPIATFRALVANEIERHNNRTGRKGSGLNGRSFAQALADGIADGAIITRATAAQRRMFLLAAEPRTCKKPTGEVELGGNRYWADELVEHMGRKVVVRFDPDNLGAGVSVYALDGRLICDAPCIDDTGFDDMSAARIHARDKKAWIKGQRDLVAIEKRLGISEVANLLPRIETADAPAQDARVVRLVPSNTRTEIDPDEERTVASFSRAVRAIAGD